jgi:protein-S-isoprenylcysteine O-methyltransferase Ste14
MKSILGSVIKLLFGCLLFAGFPLTGWGWDDVGGFFHDPARGVYIAVAVILQLVIVLLVPDAGGTGAEGKVTIRRQRWAILGLQILPLGLLLAAPFCDRRGILGIPDLEAIRLSGAVLFALGFSIMNWAEATLGAQFSIQVTVQENHRLITNGPFRFIRHPRYLGIILFNLGVSLVFRSWIGLCMVAGIFAILLWRMHDEEALMRKEFGDEWDTYVKKSRRLIPWLY